MATLSLVPLRPQHLDEAASFLVEAAEWAPYSNPNPDPSVLGSPNSVWFSALSGNDLVGILGFHNISWIDSSAEVAVGVKMAWRLKGLGGLLAGLARGKAGDLRLTRLTACAVAGSPTGRICTRAGWTREAIFRRARWKDGKFQDVEVYAWEKENTR